MPESHDRITPLASGEAIRRRQLSEIAPARYDTPPRPMRDEMHQFFFLTKHRSFIAHEYPGRWEFVRDFPHQQPIPMNGKIPSTAKP